MGVTTLSWHKTILMVWVRIEPSPVENLPHDRQHTNALVDMGLTFAGHALARPVDDGRRHA